MKKFFAAILSSVLIVTLGTGSFAAVTSAQRKAFNMYVDAMEKLNAADSVVMDMDMNMVMSVDEEEISTNIVATVAQILEDGVPTEMYMTMEMPAIAGIDGASDVTAEMFYRDGVAYMDTMGEKIKMEMPVEDFLAQASAASAQPFAFELDLVKEISYDAKGNDRIVSFVIDGEELANTSSEYLEQFTSATVVDGMDSIEYGDMTVSAVIDRKGTFKAMSMVFDLTITAEEMVLSAAYDVNMSIVQIGGVEIEFPEDLDGYIDYTALLEEALGTLENSADEEVVAEEEAAVDEEVAAEDDAAADEEVAAEDAAADEEVAADEDVAADDAE